MASLRKRPQLEEIAGLAFLPSSRDPGGLRSLVQVICPRRSKAESCSAILEGRSKSCRSDWSPVSPPHPPIRIGRRLEILSEPAALAPLGRQTSAHYSGRGRIRHRANMRPRRCRSACSRRRRENCPRAGACSTQEPAPGFSLSPHDVLAPQKFSASTSIPGRSRTHGKTRGSIASAGQSSSLLIFSGGNRARVTRS